MYNINYTFFNRYNLDFDVIDRPFGSGDYLLLFFSTPMKIKLNNKTVFTKENAFIIFDKGTAQYYSAVKSFQNSFIHFDTDIDFSKKFNIPLNKVLYFSDNDEIIYLLQKIHMEFFLKKSFYEESIDAYMNRLLICISRLSGSEAGKTVKSSYMFNIFQSAREEILKNLTRQWTCESMASLTSLGTSQFYRYYQDYFGATPKADLINARLSHAKELMINKKLSVSEAALQSGFLTPAHFSRYFKKEFQISPIEWVNSYNKELT